MRKAWAVVRNEAMPTCWRKRPTWSVEKKALSESMPTSTVAREKHDGTTYVVLLLVHLVRGHVFGGGETRGGARVGVALCDLWGNPCQRCVEGKER